MDQLRTTRELSACFSWLPAVHRRDLCLVDVLTWHGRDDNIQSCDLLVFSGGARAWNEVFNTNEDVCPLSRHDSRWAKAPIRYTSCLDNGSIRC